MSSATDAKLAYLKETKARIKSALISKGQAVSDNDTFRSYADKVLAIQGGTDAWETVVEEQTATPVYDSATLSYFLKVPSTLNIGLEGRWYGFYKVSFDGNVYLCSAFTYHYKFSQEVLGVTEFYGNVIGNPHLIKGRVMTAMTCDSKDTFIEPFAIDVANDSTMWIAVGDTKPHTVRVDYIPRGIVS